MTQYGHLLTAPQRKALADLPFEGTVFVDSFANFGDTGTLFVRQDGREALIHEDGQIVDGEGAELRAGAVA